MDFESVRRLGLDPACVFEFSATMIPKIHDAPENFSCGGVIQEERLSG